jgi:hypothetical protein
MNFKFTISSTHSLGPTQPPVWWLSGTLSLGLKGPEFEADHQPPTTAEVKTTSIYRCTAPIRINGLAIIVFIYFNEAGMEPSPLLQRPFIGRLY